MMIPFEEEIRNNGFDIYDSDEDDVDYQKILQNQSQLRQQLLGKSDKVDSSQGLMPKNSKHIQKKKIKHEERSRHEEKNSVFSSYEKWEGGFNELLESAMDNNNAFDLKSFNSVKQKKSTTSRYNLKKEQDKRIQMKQHSFENKSNFPKCQNCLWLQNNTNQLSEIQFLSLQEKIKYLDLKIQKYRRLKDKIMMQTRSNYDLTYPKMPKKLQCPRSNQLNDTQSFAKSFMNDNLDLNNEINSTKIKRKNACTPILLQKLAKKFQMYKSEENSRYYPGQKMALKTIAEQHSIGYSSVYNLYNQWLNDPFFTKKIKKLESQSKKSTDEAKSQNYQQKIAQQLDNQHSNKSDEQIGQKSEITNKTQLQRAQIAKLLADSQVRSKINLGHHPERNSPAIMEVRLNYCKNFRKIKEKKAKIYFLDQCQINYLIDDQESKQKKFALLALFGDGGLAFWKIVVSSQKKYEAIDDIEQLSERAKHEQKQLGIDSSRKGYLILDACMMKEPEKIEKLRKIFGMSILFLPPCSPQLNPIQIWFFDLKQKISDKKQKFQKSIHIALFEYQGYDFKKYYRIMEGFISRGIDNDHF